jgi:hypothetical protein
MLLGDVIARQPGPADPRQVLGVAAVVAADDEHQVEVLLVEQLHDGILSILRRAADRVERPEMIGERLVAIPVPHRPPEELLDLERFRHQHGGLVRETDADQVPRRIEARGHRVPEPLQQRVASGSGANERTDLARLVAVQDDEILSARKGEGLRGRGVRLFVVHLAVNDGGEAVPRVPGDVLPDVEHRAARRVDGHASLGGQLLRLVDGEPECRDDDDVAWAERVPALSGIRQEADPGGAQLVVDVRVVNDLARQEHVAVGKPVARLVGVVHRSVDAVAEAELLGQMHGETPGRVDEVRLPDALDEGAVVILGQRTRDGVPEIEALAKQERLWHLPTIISERSG